MGRCGHAAAKIPEGVSRQMTQSGYQRGDFAVMHTTVLVVVGYSREMKFDDPWAWMQSYDVRRFGEVIQDKLSRSDGAGQSCWPPCHYVAQG